MFLKVSANVFANELKNYRGYISYFILVTILLQFCHSYKTTYTLHPIPCILIIAEFDRLVIETKMNIAWEEKDGFFI